MSTKEKIARWFVDGEVGLSSKTMAAYLGFGIIPKRISYPHDVGDFRRCVQLLDCAPELREKIKEMRNLGNVWRALAENWQELEIRYREEKGSGSCPKTYELLEKILSENETNVISLGNVKMRIIRE